MIEYSPDMKRVRMTAVRDALLGGRLELLDGQYLLAQIPLNGGDVEGPELSYGVSQGIATIGGTPDSARLKDYYGRVIAEGLVVGLDVILDADSVAMGQSVRIVSCVIRHG